MHQTPEILGENVGGDIKIFAQEIAKCEGKGEVR